MFELTRGHNHPPDEIEPEKIDEVKSALQNSAKTSLKTKRPLYDEVASQ